MNAVRVTVAVITAVGALAGAAPGSHLPRGYEGFRVAFADDRHGIMSATRVLVPCPTEVCPFSVYASADGGKRWRRVLRAPLSVGSVAELAAAPRSDVFWAAFPCNPGATCRSRVFRSDDGGSRWRVISHAWLRAPAFATVRDGWAVGGEGTVVATHDGGRSWRALPRDPCPGDAGYTRAPAPVSVTRGWVLCYEVPAIPGQRALYETRDGGRTWHLRAARSASLPRVGRGFDNAVAVRNISFTRSGRGWIWRYASAAPLVTRDGGGTWRLATSRKRWPFPSMTWGSAPLDGTAFALADTTRQQLLARTRDGGASWRVVHRWPRGTRSAPAS